MLAFGLSLSAWVFTKVTKPLLQWARQQGIRLTASHDDFLIMALPMAPSRNLSRQHTQMVKEKMLQLGWLVNLSKSQLLEHLGMTLNTKNMSISIPGKKIRSIRRQAYHLLYQAEVKVKQLAAFIGAAMATQLGNQCNVGVVE
ncbi:hypothetical protein BCR42DRAFT_337250 [Absidia repens]|uniref:Reverse transcriptase domain-containing protein n=1 Tax=Absidia repens TaxID=90262 RepID=A0A1X2HZX6_9FUNG|nr:hypothetical protein BCR42DRAFT_337250 [Absidia repens]